MSLNYTYLDVAKMIDHSLLNPTLTAADLEAAVDRVLAAGYRTGDLMAEGCTLLGCQAMGERLLEAFEG